jgi:hypothetical protein
MSPKKKQRKLKPIIENTNTCENIIEHNQVSTTHFTEIEPHNIIQNQDDEYEMSVIMDIIKMQEKEYLEKLKKEQEQEIERQNSLQEKLIQRDHNIKEILRKMKFQLSNLNAFEISFITLLENIMNTQHLIIMLDDKNLYNNINNYLGLTNKKGTIRLNDSVKEYARNLFQLNINI